jgi:CAAX protease family protein
LDGATVGASRSVRTSALTYFVLALGWSSAFWTACGFWSTAADPADSFLFLLGGAGPFVAAAALTQFREPPPVRRDFWRRVVDPRPLRWPWWSIALLLHPTIVALAVAGDLALGGAPPVLRAELGSTASVASLVFFVFWFGPLPEELGWRGFALDRLQARTGALQASLTLGAVWSLWHVPLFFVPGSFQAGLGPGSLRFWVFLAGHLPLSVLMTWIYNNTARSTLSAVLVHFSGNLFGALFVKTDRLAALEVGVLCIAAALVVAGAGARRLTRRCT